ncbi:MAG TPA: methyltransferase domain-containing protein [Gammaproteobacteria bacterium]|nr:methyltransferase domain-containing protein [Gammaproteobacteria bacterium]
MGDVSIMQTDREAWWQTKTGAYLFKQERAALKETLPMVFGYYLVQSGCWGPPGTLMEASPIRTRLIVGDCGAVGAGVTGDPCYLPFTSDAVDAVLLPHTLEQVAEPEQVLREAERVLRGEGQVLVLGFHPLGPWGLMRHFRRRPEWGGRFLGVGRLKVWLAVLGFEVVDVKHLVYRPPWRSRLMLLRSAFLDRLAWRATAGVYLVVAKKRVFGMTPLQKRRVRPQPSFSGVAKPTTRSMQ